MQLFGYLASPYVARTVLVTRWKGSPVELTPPPGGSIKSGEYLAINPLGKMPALEAGGRHLAESTVICEYLDETLPGRRLLPDDPMDRAQSRLLARLLDTYVVTHFGALFRNANPARRNDAEVEAAIAALRANLAHVEHFMGPGPWTLGDEPGFADAILAPTFFVAFALLPMFGGRHDLLEGLPKLARWWQAVEADPVSGALKREYDVAFKAFLASRLKAA
ncbi:MAG: hypothetical protein AMXMBFR37_18730 [Steroidobacteraceae bacterium]